MKRLSLLAAVAVVLSAGPAWAHEEINPSTFPTGKPTFLTLTAANEKQVRLNKVTLNSPSGLPFGATTRAPSGWTVARTDTTVTWTGGFVDPDRFESFGFEIEGADQPGTLNYKATLGYADGSNDDVTVPVTATVAASSTSGASGSSDSGSGRATAALGLAVVALALAVAALAMGRRRSAGPSSPSPSTSKAVGAEQDW